MFLEQGVDNNLELRSKNSKYNKTCNDLVDLCPFHEGVEYIDHLEAFTYVLLVLNSHFGTQSLFWNITLFVMIQNLVGRIS
jgi:hypothetical protein